MGEEFTTRKGKQVLPDGTMIPDITPVKIIVSEATGDPGSLTKDDVWGKFDPETHEKISDGMIVARYGDVCPVFGDTVPYKSVTVVCDPQQAEQVAYWLEYVHGGDCISAQREYNGKLAFRSDYQAW